MRVLSGIQPSGVFHLGNYVGAVKRWVDNQERHDSFYMVADLHAITFAHDPAKLAANTRATVAALIACGLDPDANTIFVQSTVGEHERLTWLLSAVAQTGELSRMTQFKEKSSRSRDSASLALFSYPVLQAADILLYDAELVPVGDDQRQHIELTRDIAERFNKRYGSTFVVPQAVLPDSGARVMDLQQPSNKMSKSLNSPMGTIFLDDDSTAIGRKIRKAVTDTGSRIHSSPDKPGITNLLTIWAALGGHTIREAEERFARATYGALKDEVAVVVAETFAPIRSRYLELMSAPDALDDIIGRSALRACEVAAPTLERARGAIGLGMQTPLRLAKSDLGTGAKGATLN